LRCRFGRCFFTLSSGFFSKGELEMTSLLA
jgi:hypothetical protein